MSYNVPDDFVIKRYADKKRLFSYIARVKEGLSQEEKIIVKKYFLKNGSILIVGCGTGRGIYGLKKLGYQNITGVDISPDMIKAAKKIIKKVNFYCADIVKFNINKKFDCIFYPNNVLEQITSLDNREKAISKAKKLLKKDGIVIFTTHSRFIPGNWGSEWLKNLYLYFIYILKIRKTSPFDFIDEENKIYAHYSNPFWISSIIKKTGLEILEINSKNQIIKGQKSQIKWLFDEPVYYVAHNPD